MALWRVAEETNVDEWWCSHLLTLWELARGPWRLRVQVTGCERALEVEVHVESERVGQTDVVDPVDPAMATTGGWRPTDGLLS